MAGGRTVASRVLGCVLALILSAGGAGCAVVRVARGEPGVDVRSVQPGVARTEAEAILGPPLRQWVSATGIRYCTYEYDAGRPPSVGEAVGWVILDVVMFGIFELVALWMPPEKVFGKNSSARLVLSYDERDVVLGVFNEFDELPPDGRSEPHPLSR